MSEQLDPNVLRDISEILSSGDDKSFGLQFGGNALKEIDDARSLEGISRIEVIRRSISLYLFVMREVIHNRADVVFHYPNGHTQQMINLHSNQGPSQLRKSSRWGRFFKSRS